MSSRLSKVKPEECIFLICDIQERFRSVIYHYPSVIHAAKILLEAAELFQIPVIATEQYPRALGHTGKCVYKVTTTTTSVESEGSSGRVGYPKDEGV